MWVVASTLSAHEQPDQPTGVHKQYFNKPAFDKLLPDPLPAPHQRPYTLLIDLEGFLVHSSWDVSSCLFFPSCTALTTLS
jgi:hypothetical protein